jgi:hypothetical protein
MTNNQIDPNQEPNENQLSDEELEGIAGGGIFDDLVDAGKELAQDAIDAGQEFISDFKDAWDKLT